MEPEKENSEEGEEEKEKKGTDSSAEVAPELSSKIDEARAIPIPGRDDIWTIERLVVDKRQNKKIFGLFNRKILSAEEIKDLRKSAIQSPGNTRARIKKLQKQHPNNPLLLMLSAICTSGMLMNSSNQKEVLRGLKNATREATLALTADGISVYNCEHFFRIYFTMIDRFRRSQAKVYDSVSQNPRLEQLKRELVSAMKVIDLLSGDKSRVFKVLNHIKKKLKSSNYAATFEFSTIRDAVKFIEMGNYKEMLELGTAGEIIAYVYALSVAFARVPILSTLIDEILQLLPDSNKTLLLRKISIRSVRNFSKFKIATIEGDRESMAKIGQAIFKDNFAGIQKLEGQSLYQGYETDPFFNLAFVAELTVGLYNSDDHAKILNTALTAISSVVSRDMSKNHIFTDSANNHTQKLLLLKEGHV